MRAKTFTVWVLGALLICWSRATAVADIDVHPAFVHPFSEEHLNHLVSLVNPRCEVVGKVAREMSTPEDAFNYVRDRIDYMPRAGAEPPWRTIVYGAGSCYSKAILLCSIYRAMGARPDQVHVVLGEVEVDGRHLPHSWVEIEYGGRRLLLDASAMLGCFDYGETPSGPYHEEYVIERVFTLNDRGYLPAR